MGSNLWKIGLAAVAGCWMAASCQGQYIYTESFTNTTAPGWVFGGTTTPTLTANTVDSPGNGWLRLTPNTNDQSNYAYFTTAIPAGGNRVEMTFDFVMYNGSGADGIAFNLSDASLPYSAGAFGGSMGYAQKTGIDGTAGGYIGVAIDGFGNYSNPTEGRIGGPGVVDNAIAVRGPGSGQNGYEYLGGTGDLGAGSLDFYGSTTRPSQTGADFRQLRVLLDEHGFLTVSLKQGATGQMTDLYTLDLSPYARPDEFTLSFTAATGGSTGIHEIRNLTVISSEVLGGIEWDNGSGDLDWGTGTNWYSSNPSYNNLVPAAGSHVVFGNRPAGSGAQSIDMEANRTVGSMTFSSTEHVYTIEDNGDTIAMNGNGDVASINMTATQNVTIAADIDTDDATTINQNGSALLTISGNIDNQGNLLTLNGTGNTTISGVISDSGGLTMKGTGTGTLTANNTYTGATLVDNGTLVISGANGDIAQSSSVTIGGCAILHLDNSSANNGNRIGNVPLNMEGGTFIFTPHASASSAETIGELSINASDNTIDTGTAASGQTSILTFDSLDRTAGATLNFKNNPQFGSTTNDRNRITFNDAPTLTNSVITDGGRAFATVDNEWATYAGGEVRALGIYDNGAQSGWNTADNVKMTANQTLSNSRTVNTLNIQSNTGLTLGQSTNNRTLTIGTGGLLVSGDADHTIATRTLRGSASGELIVHTQTAEGSLIVTSTIANNGGATGLTKSGAGSMVLSGGNANTFTGNTHVNEGTLRLNKSAGTDAIADGTIIVRCGGTLLLGTSHQIDNSVDMVLDGGTFDTAGFDETLGSLTLTDTSTLNLGNGNSDVRFSSSNTESWDRDATLIVTNWNGSSSGGGTDQIRFGTSGSGLTSSQLNQISFLNPNGLSGTYRATILANGEVVALIPSIPEASTALSAILLTSMILRRRPRRRGLEAV